MSSEVFLTKNGSGKSALAISECEVVRCFTPFANASISTAPAGFFIACELVILRRPMIGCNITTGILSSPSLNGTN